MEDESLLSRVGKNIANPLYKAFSLIQNVVPGQLEESELDKLNKRILQLFVYVIRIDNQIKDSEVEALKDLVHNFYGSDLIDELDPLLEQEELPNIEEICEGLNILGQSERLALMRCLFIICFSDNEFCSEEQDIMVKIAQLLNISEEQVIVEEKEALQEHNRRMRILNSSTGLVAAFVVIAIFILAASFLRSVFFGLILAYFFLPLQQALLQSFLNDGIVAKVIRILNKLFVAPFVAISSGVKRYFSSDQSPPKGTSQAQPLPVAIARSCHATVMIVALMGLLFCGAVVAFTVFKYQQISIDSLQQELMRTIQKLNTIPFLSEISAQIDVTHPPDLHGVEKPLLEFGHMAFDYLVSILSSVGHLFLNAFMSLFFFSFFLNRMAEFQHQHGTDSSAGDYLVQSLFESSWLPNTSKETITGATDIIDQIFFMLKTWVRGYMWIILIEVPIYCVLFALLGVPYPLILGSIAGLTVLLPFLGPIISFALTCGLCMMFTDGLIFNNMTFVYILIIYFVLHSIVEQLFLYPALVGEALGLNVLETLIVVLLGGVFSGITGMILAVPVASILKFIIPRIYRSQLSFKELSFPSISASGVQPEPEA